MNCISQYVHSLPIRVLAIDRIRKRSGDIPGCDEIRIKQDSECIELINLTRYTQLGKLPRMEVRYVEIPKPDGKTRGLGISSILDRVLQTQAHFLLDPFYESKFPEHMYGFRKGRNPLNAIGLVKRTLETADSKTLGAISLDIYKCFDRINHQAILEHFKVPKVLASLLNRWLTPLIRDNQGKKVGVQTRGIAQGSVIGPLICNVILMKSFDNIFSEMDS